MLNRNAMAIDDYKKKLIAIVEEMQKEHGCVVESVNIERKLFSGWPALNDTATYEVTIEL